MSEVNFVQHLNEALDIFDSSIDAEVSLERRERVNISLQQDISQFNTKSSTVSFEVTPDKDIVWEYWNPFKFDYKLPDGSPAQPGGSVTLYGLFRASQYDANFPAFSGKDLKPIQPQPEAFVFKMPPPPPTNDSNQ